MCLTKAASENVNGHIEQSDPVAMLQCCSGLVVGGQNFSDPRVVVMVLVVAIVGLRILMPFRAW
jgi:hypothetical protein